MIYEVYNDTGKILYIDSLGGLTCKRAAPITLFMHYHAFNEKIKYTRLGKLKEKTWKEKFLQKISKLF